MYNIFYRAEGQEYYYADLKGTGITSKEREGWYVQYDGTPEYDSGYTQFIFKTEAEADTFLSKAKTFSLSDFLNQ